MPRSANEQQIKRSYRKLALQYHPDKVSGNEEQKAEAAKRFAEINHAYETLSGERSGSAGGVGVAVGGGRITDWPHSPTPCLYSLARDPH